MAVHNEIEFEKELAEHLAANGWLYSPNDDGYDRERGLFPEDVLGWLADTQPEQLTKVVKPGSGDVAKQQDQLLDRIVKVLDIGMDNGGGTLNLLRNGFSYVSAKLQMCVFKPETTLNAKRNADYAAVRVRVMRQVHFSTSDQRSVDVVFFVNGLPVATAELKTDFTQTITDAIIQYRTSRQPKDPATGKIQPLFVSGGRALVHFAVTEAEVWMTTALAGEKTHFLPFNRGAEDGGAGNPPNSTGPRTAYLWERVLQPSAQCTRFWRPGSGRNGEQDQHSSGGVSCAKRPDAREIPGPAPGHAGRARQSQIRRCELRAVSPTRRRVARLTDQAVPRVSGLCQRGALRWRRCCRCNSAQRLRCPSSAPWVPVAPRGCGSASPD
jgi:hypothetical protein